MILLDNFISTENLVELIKWLGIFISGGGATWMYNRRKERLDLKRITQENENSVYSGYKTAVTDLNQSYQELREHWTDAQASLIVLESEITKLRIVHDRQKIQIDNLKYQLDECQKNNKSDRV